MLRVDSPDRPRSRWLAWVLLGAALAAWAPGLRGSFHYDDWPNIVRDPATSEIPLLLERLAGGFRPLLRLSYALDHALWGWDAAGFVLTNLLLHAATVLAVWRLARRRLAGEGAALCAAAVFALQPAHAAVVAWASGRSAGLSTLCIVLALLAHERWVSGDGRRWLAGSLCALALAAAAKETALVLPGVLLLWERTRDGRPPWREAARRCTPMAAWAALLLTVALAASARLRELVAYSLTLGSPADALWLHAAALPQSLSLWVLPWQLAVEHAQDFPTGARLAGGLAVAAIAVAAWHAAARCPLATLALLWPLLALVPTHSVLARLDPVVEKPLYLAWIGPALALGALLAHACASTRGRAAVFSLLLLLCATSAWRAGVWASPATLWREATEAAPRSVRAWSNRAVAELSAGRAADARTSIGVALALDPGSEQALAIAEAASLLSGPIESRFPEEKLP